MKMKSFRDYLELSNSCSYDVDDVIGRADRFGFQNFCSPALKDYVKPGLCLIATVQKCNEKIRVKKTVQQLKTG